MAHAWTKDCLKALHDCESCVHNDGDSKDWRPHNRETCYLCDNGHECNWGPRPDVDAADPEEEAMALEWGLLCDELFGDGAKQE